MAPNLEEGASRTTAFILRFFVSPKEYQLLVNKYAASYKNLLLTPQTLVQSAERRGDALHGIVRSQARVYVVSYGLVAALNALILKRRGKQIAAARLAASITSISAIYKILYKVLDTIVHRLQQAILREKSAAESRPATSESANGKLVSTLSKLSKTTFKRATTVLVPVLSGLVAGSAFSLFPASSRGYISLYVCTRTAEFVYNYLDDLGYLAFKPRVLGSWALFPFAFSQLFYTWIFHPESCPDIFKNIMLKLSTGYLPGRPTGYPIDLPWPSTDQVLDGIATVSRARYPKFISPILFPKLADLPQGLEMANPVVSMAHPAINTITGALTHPSEPSEFRNYMELVLNDYSWVSKYVFLGYGAVAVLRSRFNTDSTPSLLLSTVLNTARTSTFAVMTAASAWYGIGLSQQLLNNKFIPVMRYRVIGFLAGLWAVADPVSGRARYLYAVRLALMAHWNILTKQHGGRPVIKHGDVLLFAASFAALMTVFDVSPQSIPGTTLRKILQWVKTNKFVDPAPTSDTVSKISKDE